MKIAAIDIGTNTCNLLIADYSISLGLIRLHKEKQAITLINPDFCNNCISHDSIMRLLNILQNYKQTINNHDVTKIIASATSGIRSAANKESVVDILQKNAGLEIKVIDGDKEADLVYHGVKNAIQLTEIPVLLIDIGGGSIEFVICNNEKLIWKASYNIGVARIMNLNKFSDPLVIADIEKIYSILDENLKELLVKCSEHKISTIIGSSGSYETFANLIKFELHGENIRSEDKFNHISLVKFHEIHDSLIRLNEEERTNMKGMEIIRVKMIPVAAVITKYLIERLKIDNLLQSNYSIKEGLIFDYLSNNI